MKACCRGQIVIAAYAIIVHELCVHSIIAGDRVNVTAVFCQINHYGYYLCIHIMLGSGLFSLEKYKLYRCIGFISIVINTAALALNSSFGPWLACVCAFLFQVIVLAIVKHRFDMRSLTAAMSFLFVSAIMGFWTDNIFSSIFQFMTDVKSVADDSQVADSAGTGRWELWKFTVERIFEKPLFGYGIEGINQALEEATGSSRPHNELLQYAVFYGIPAALIYIAGFFSVFIRGFKYRKSLDNATIICLTGAFAYLISSLFGNTMFYTAPFFFIFLGLGYYDASRE